MTDILVEQKPAYRVELNPACKEYNDVFVIIGPAGELNSTFKTRDDAEDFAKYLNDAFAAGAKSVVARSE